MIDRTRTTTLRRSAQAIVDRLAEAVGVERIAVETQSAIWINGDRWLPLRGGAFYAVDFDRSIIVNPSHDWKPGPLIGVLSHEFGHYLQWLDSRTERLAWAANREREAFNARVKAEEFGPPWNRDLVALQAAYSAQPREADAWNRGWAAVKAAGLAD